MNKKIGMGIVVIAIVAVSMFAGCVAEEAPATTPSPSPTLTPIPEPKYSLLTIIPIFVAILALLAYVYYEYHKKKTQKIEREKPVILKMRDFLKQTIDKLNKDIRDLNRINISYFPEFLNFQFGIPPNLLKNDIYGRFIKRKPRLKKDLEKYNELCSELNKTIGKLKQMGYDEGVITDPTTTRNLNPETIVTKIVMEDRYENSDRKAEILKEKGLDVKIVEIKKFTESEKLDKKAENLIQRLEKIKGKYQDK